MTDYSFIANAHPSYIDSLYAQFQDNPDALDESWRLFFSGFDYGFKEDGNGATPSNGTTITPGQLGMDELRVLALIIGYRNRGHLKSTTNPIKKRMDRKPFLDLADFSLTEKNLDKKYVAGKRSASKMQRYSGFLTALNQVYCGNIGFEFHHIQDRNKRRWLRKRIEDHTPTASST